MKKIISLLFILSFFSLANTVLACEQASDLKYSNIGEVLSLDDTAIGIYQPTTEGVISPALLFIGNKNSIMNMTLVLDSSSCGSRENSFTKNEYIVSVFNKNDETIKHSPFDNQFSFSFPDKKSAMEKYIELTDKWEKRAIYIGDISETGELTYINTNYTLKPGMKDNYVLALQKALKEKLSLGDDFKLDGSYGPATLAAVKQFQESVDLENDGLAGVLTQDKLKGALIGKVEKNPISKYINTNYTLKPGMKDNYVLALQKALKEKLSLGDDFKLDGSYGPATLAAVKQFQESVDLENDGLAGVLTQDKLAEMHSDATVNNKNTSDKNNSLKKTIEKKDEINTDLINSELKKILLQAKNKVINETSAQRNYTDAHEFIIQYNNELLGVYDYSDPLYNSSQGGKYFVYSVKITDGSYICVDSTSQNDVVSRDTRPNLDLEEISC